jgi:hypothetical protein
MKRSADIAAVAVTLALVQGGCAHVTEIGFWFDNVRFELPPEDTRLLGGPLTAAEQERIVSVATRELRTAFDGLRVSLSRNPTAFYRVRVMQKLADPSSAGAAVAIVPLGGVGAVSFQTVARWAMRHAPPDADRATIVDGLGRGIGRVAVHELAHQILVSNNFHGSRDRCSYEYESPDRACQFYGTLHWDTSWPLLARKLGRHGCC